MKNEEEIRTLLASKLKQMKSIDTRSIWFVRLASEIDMLKWVLEDNENVENE
jgi:hypothetical protein